MIRCCTSGDFEAIQAAINDAAEAYRGVIAPDCWKEPYMPREELREEIRRGVVFWAFEESARLTSVMGLQHVDDVALIRHAYTRTARQRAGLGTALLEHLRRQTHRPLLVGTWKAATWAVSFYERLRFRLVPQDHKGALLRRYWTVPNRQIDESVVLAEEAWFMNGAAASPPRN